MNPALANILPFLQWRQFTIDIGATPEPIQPDPVSVSAMTIDYRKVSAQATGHGFRVGDRVVIAGVTGPNGYHLNGIQLINTAPDADNFTFVLQIPSADLPSGSVAGTVTAQLTPINCQRALLFASLDNSGEPAEAVFIGPDVAAQPFPLAPGMTYLIKSIEGQSKETVSNWYASSTGEESALTVFYE